MKLHSSNLKRYWRRRNYERLNTKPNRSGKIVFSRPGGAARRRFFRVKISPVVAFLRRRLLSPKKLLLRLRDAYVKIMMKMADSSAMIGAGGFGFGFYGGPAGAPFNRTVRKEFDEAAILQMYRTLVAQGKIIPVAAGGAGEIIRA